MSAYLCLMKLYVGSTILKSKLVKCIQRRYICGFHRLFILVILLLVNDPKEIILNLGESFLH